MSKYEIKFKVKLVKENIENSNSPHEIALKYNISESLVRRWIRLYKYHGIKGLENKNKKYDSIYKEYVVEYMILNQLSYQETAIKFNVKDITVKKWFNKYKEKTGKNEVMNKKAKKENKTKEELIKENELLKMENEYLKKYNALVQKMKQEEKKKYKQ